MSIKKTRDILLEFIVGCKNRAAFANGLLDVCACLLLSLQLFVAIDSFAIDNDSNTPASSPNNTPEFFFDADTTRFSSMGTSKVFEGDVVAIGSNLLINADTIELLDNNSVMHARGNVVVFAERQVFLATEVTYELTTSKFSMLDAVLIVNDSMIAGEMAETILGLSREELKFNQSKQHQIGKILLQQQKIVEDYVMLQSPNELPSDSLVQSYVQLSNQVGLIRENTSPFLAKLTQSKRERYLKRRDFWEAQKLKYGAKLKSNGAGVWSYFKIEAKVIAQKEVGEFSALESRWTPCRCEDDEHPAWSVHASKLKGVSEGYLDFAHPVIEIAGVPILYLPFARLPLKEKRQSGFLIPSFYGSSQSGNVVAQEIYLALTEDSDSTLSLEYFDSRGTKLGLQYRYQSTASTGWNLDLEGMNDEVWGKEIERRKNSYDAFFDQKAQDARVECAASSGGDPVVERDCIISRYSGIGETLEWPKSQVRYRTEWDGVSLLSDRIGIASRGRLFSDHRYVEDLEFSTAQDVLEGKITRTSMFSGVDTGVYYSQPSYLLALSSHIGDSVLDRRSFDGIHIPLRAQAASRYFSLGLLGKQIHFRAAATQMYLREFVGESKLFTYEDFEEELESVDYSEILVSQRLPLLSRSVITLEQFSDYRMRKTFIAKNSSDGTLYSPRVGLTVGLPLFGESFFPDALVSFFEKGTEPQFLRHHMNWYLTYSVRPSITRYGNYALVDDGSVGSIYYFASDSPTFDSGSYVALQDTMTPHSSLELSTSHRWESFRRSVSEKAKNNVEMKDHVTGGPSETSGSDDESGDSPKTQHAIAIQEIMASAEVFRLNSKLRKFESIEEYSRIISGFNVEEQDRASFLTMDAKIAYDFESEKSRNEELKKRRSGLSEDTGERGLPQPWSQPALALGLNMFSLALSNATIYNIYFKKVVEQDFTLSLPTFFATSLILGLEVANKLRNSLAGDELVFDRTTTQSYRVQTGLVRNFSIFQEIGVRKTEYVVEEGVETVPSFRNHWGVSYLSPSDCWRLDFLRKKDFDRDPIYFVALSILFLGKSFGQDRNVAPAFNLE